MIKQHNDYYEVSNKNELLEAMKKKAMYILIKDDMDQEVKSLLKTNLTEEDSMGAELGTHGSIGLLSEIPYQIIQYFSGKPKIDRKLESAIRMYKYKMENGNILLYLKQLDY
ncbi:MAG TPA: hypothetical protein H9808_08355 [Candidatus Atopostipes pullistercoris]|uniref:Uncharacterized protein n=1 Tax=Candidatus Atopostipes pullistercoris TaxID=2838467 RepID=A0A9D2G418_9LACT|nr:hypothetical protein [Candidatus Atopostipes pullistercoris]